MDRTTIENLIMILVVILFMFMFLYSIENNQIVKKQAFMVKCHQFENIPVCDSYWRSGQREYKIPLQVKP